MIFTDGIHLVSDESVDELHEFAQAIGFKRCWFQNRRCKRSPHYDLTTNRKVNQAIGAGAVLTDSIGVIQALRRWREGGNNGCPVDRDEY